MIEQIERGDGSDYLDTLRKPAGAFGLPLCALLEGVDDRIASGRFGPRLVQLRERRGRAVWTSR